MSCPVAFFLVPTITALIASRQTSDPEFRLLCAALAGAALAATACSFTFDSLSYPMFTGLYALVIGLIGAAWQFAVAARPRDGPFAAHAVRRTERCCRREADCGPGDDLAEDLAASDRDAAGDRPDAARHLLRDRDQDAGVQRDLHLHPDQSAGAADAR